MENNIKKIYAVILDRRFFHEKETGANCKVYVTENDDKSRNYDINLIKEIFPSNGVVFSGYILGGLNASLLQINDFIEISLDEILPKNEDSQNTYIKHQSVKKVGVKIIDIPFELVNQNFLDIEKINEKVNTISIDKGLLGKFYLSDSQNLFGPFKMEKNKICPVTGKSVFKYDFNIDHLIDIENAPYSYLIEEPKNKITELDCMSKIQVLEHLKSILKNFQNINIDINKIRDLKEAIININTGSEELNTIRLSRANQYLTELELSYEEINNLKSNNDNWQTIFNNNYQKHKNEFVKEFIKDAESTKIVKEQEIKNLQNQIIKIEEILKEKNNNLKEITKEIEHLNEKKDDLILSIKLSAGIIEPSTKINSQIEKNEYYLCEEDLNMELPIYEDCDDYLDDLTDNNIISSSLKVSFIDSIFCLQKGNFLLSNNIGFVTTLIKSFGSYKMIQQNTELDWIKYDFLFNNGLKDIIENSIKNSSIPHFYVLQDINIACFECYAKPIIDIANGVRNKISGLNIDWPSNLFFIGIPIEIEIDDFGFEMQRETFKNWQALPYIENFSPPTYIKMSHRMILESTQINYDMGYHFERYF